MYKINLYILKIQLFFSPKNMGYVIFKIFTIILYFKTKGNFLSAIHQIGVYLFNILHHKIRITKY